MGYVTINIDEDYGDVKEGYYSHNEYNHISIKRSQKEKNQLCSLWIEMPEPH